MATAFIKFRTLSIWKHSITFCLFFLNYFLITPFHFSSGGIYLDLVLCYYFKNIQVMVSYHVPVFLSMNLSQGYTVKYFFQSIS